MALRRLALAVALAAGAPMAWAAEPDREPSFLHGAGQALAGLTFEWPKNILTGTLEGPPVVGTAFGILGGAARAAQKTVGGIVEMSQGFDPWGVKRRR
jgi:hypothetical protein